MKKILIADDNLQITKILSEFAKKEGFEPVTAMRPWNYFKKSNLPWFFWM